MLHGHEVVMYVHGNAELRLLLWRRKYISFDNFVEEVCASALGSGWTMIMNLGSKLILYWVQRTMLDNMVIDWQLVD